MTSHPDPERPVALVTGGTSRIGRAVVRELARAGMDIFFTFKDSDAAAHTLVDEIAQGSARCVAVRIDFSDPHAVEQLHGEFDAHYRRLDVLVNNASLFAPTPVAELTERTVNEFMHVNAVVPLRLIQHFAPLLRARYNAREPGSTGRVVNFIDIHVLGEPLSGFVAYNASKAALMEITMTCAVELAPSITVNAIAPGVIGWTDFQTEEYRQGFLARVPLARTGTPEETAKAVRFLVGDGSYCTGQVIRLDGGRLLT
jgi:pteridine reductase